MPQHDYDIANADGATVRADINSALGAITSNNSGPVAPSTTEAHMWWADTTASILKRRNSTNTGWIDVMPLDSGVVAGQDVQEFSAALTSLNGVTFNAGDIFYATGPDTLVPLNRGANGEVLTLAAGAPSWVEPASVSGIDHLERFTLLNSGTLDFEHPDWITYSHFKFALRAQVSANLNIHMRMGFDDPVTYLTGNSDYNFSGQSYNDNGNGTLSNTASSIPLTSRTIYKGGDGYNEGCTIHGEVFPASNPDSTDGIAPSVLAQNVHNHSTTGNITGGTCAGTCRGRLNNPDGMRIFTIGGNFIDGIIDWYGVRGGPQT